MKNSYLILVSILLFVSCGQQPVGEIENKIKVGSVGFHIAFKVPNDSIQRMEVFLKTHQKFMRETHHVKGEVEPLVLTYAVLKAPELNNPLDPIVGKQEILFMELLKYIMVLKVPRRTWNWVNKENRCFQSWLH